ncbi:hypothetical protein PsYK624_136660 [Phanerochaete sordida]|uniref:Uncharacterized protein n=1 Tax=Phanerochaete sordida TaxID=48140 RepID=A0A9P3GL18_9APHY|nr:hypothetical protein PsYK624_136660 [Phanerochaete sordida]
MYLNFGALSELRHGILRLPDAWPQLQPRRPIQDHQRVCRYVSSLRGMSFSHCSYLRPRINIRVRHPSLCLAQVATPCPRPPKTAAQGQGTVRHVPQYQGVSPSLRHPVILLMTEHLDDTFTRRDVLGRTSPAMLPL